MRIEELETPVPVIDLDRVEHNLAKLQTYCDRHGLRLRPHIKTHKVPGFARRQVELGAVGITCQKLGEAEVMAAAGLDDVLISYPLLGPAKAARLAALAASTRMLVAVDNPLALETASSAARQAGAAIGVLVEFDSGRQRTGVTSVAAALDLARAVRAQDGLRFDGLMTYPSSAASAAFVAAAMPAFAAEGLSIRIVSGGGTPLMWQAHTIAGVTEVRVGTYIFHDRATVGAGVATLAECALHVHATVVSRPTPDRAIIDAGSKVLSSDLVAPEVGAGYGLLPAYPDALIDRVNEEHGMLDLTHCIRKPELGERVVIVPNHVCVVVNLHDQVMAARAGQVVDTLDVAARGRSR